MRLLVPTLTALSLIAIGCGDITDPHGDDDPVLDLGSTTPSDIPAGDLPSIPVPQNVGDILTNVSAVNTAIEPLAGDFLPWVTALTGDWSIVREGRILDALVFGEMVDCRYTVINSSSPANSADINFGARQVNCDQLGPVGTRFPYRFVSYPNQGARISTWLNARDEVTAHRPYLVTGGAVQAPGIWQVRLEDPYRGEIKLPFGVPLLRDACLLSTGAGVLIPKCSWRIGTTGSVTQRTLTSPVYLRRDRFWEKAEQSAVFANSADSQISRSFTRSWSVGTASTESESFARTVTAGLGAAIPMTPFTASVSASLNQTFGTSVTISTTEGGSETYDVTVAGRTTAVFEVWNLVEQYSFTDADGDPFEDPNYTFELAGLTSRAKVAIAFVSTPFPN